MPRWIPEDHKTILQAIADDERRPVNEREAARRELAGPVAQLSSPSPRRGRNANVAQTQADIDNDIECSFRYDSQLTTQDRIEVERGFEPSTQAILAAFGSSVLWLFGNNLAEIQLLGVLTWRWSTRRFARRSSEPPSGLLQLPRQQRDLLNQLPRLFHIDFHVTLFLDYFDAHWPRHGVRARGRPDYCQFEASQSG